MSAEIEGCPVPEKKSKLEDEVISTEAQSKLDKELLDAAKENNTEQIKALIKKGADVTHQEEEKGASALMLVAEQGNCEAISLLLTAGAVWNALDRQHKCAGDYATDAGHQKAIDAILQHAVICEMILGAAKKHAEKDESVKKEKMDAQGYGDNHEYLRSKIKYDKNDVEGLLLGTVLFS